LRDSHPDLKAIFMSGYFDEAINDSSLNSGDFEFIQKPFSVQQLASRISGFLSTQV
jgi:FixJ family two-component response regulator